VTWGTFWVDLGSWAGWLAGWLGWLGWLGRLAGWLAVWLAGLAGWLGVPGFRVSGFRVPGLGFQGLGFQGLGFQGLGFQGLGLQGTFRRRWQGIAKKKKQTKNTSFHFWEPKIPKKWAPQLQTPNYSCRNLWSLSKIAKKEKNIAWHSRRPPTQSEGGGCKPCVLSWYSFAERYLLSAPWESNGGQLQKFKN
jgi:hypothetical protein